MTDDNEEYKTSIRHHGVPVAGGDKGQHVRAPDTGGGGAGYQATTKDSVEGHLTVSEGGMWSTTSRKGPASE